ncbi:M48 family metallopeptidase, partial [Dermacoccus nishinomiyaensis]|uniref:M48 family metallopeptidase n=1 Tax=Dermacoccus nishinomiyaensis TaxID=1274 RepID=UPI00248EBE1A
AQELVNLVTLAMRADVTASALRDGIWTHPSATEALNEVKNSFEEEQGITVAVQTVANEQLRQQFKDAERQSEREMVAGESHYVWGNRYRLKTIERPGGTHFEIDGDRLVLYIPPGRDSAQRRTALDRWYREQLRHVLPDVIATWEDKLGLSVPKWSIRRMKTKWGSCNRETRHIWFNTELAKKHPDCVEYIVVHEMTHYLERGHGERFTKLMDRELPDWRSRRERLNREPLAEDTRGRKDEA